MLLLLLKRLTFSPILSFLIGLRHRVFAVPLEEVEAADETLVPLVLHRLCLFILCHGMRLWEPFSL